MTSTGNTNAGDGDVLFCSSIFYCSCTETVAWVMSIKGIKNGIYSVIYLLLTWLSYTLSSQVGSHSMTIKTVVACVVACDSTCVFVHPVVGYLHKM